MPSAKIPLGSQNIPKFVLKKGKSLLPEEQNKIKKISLLALFDNTFENHMKWYIFKI